MFYVLYALIAYLLSYIPFIQTRGNQREIDRMRAQKRKEKYAKQTKDDGLTPQQRKERDAAALAAKLAAKQAKKEAEAKQ